jgi:uncharacterized protein YoxC
MFPFDVTDFILTMAGILFVIGILTFIAGVYILVTKVLGSDVSAIARQTAKLGQKGLAEDVAGLVGNASALLDAVNNLVRTSAGIGIFLIFVSFVLMGGAYGLISQIK